MKKAAELKTGSEKQKQQKNHGNFVMTRYSMQNHGAPCFQLYISARLLGRKKRKEKTQLPQTNNLKTTRSTSLFSDSETRSSPFTADVVEGFPGRFRCPQTF